MIARSARGRALTTALGLAAIMMAGQGCGVGPRTFKDLQDPAPFVRARAAGLGREVPATVAVPALIDRLEDPDGVVRMSACEALRQRTGQDFGYVPWADPSERAEAVARWRSWWASQGPRRQAGLANSRRKS